MWTIASPQSTSTHSPMSSPSVLTMSPPASFTPSRTLDASALVCRFEVPLATTTRSNSAVRWLVLNTLMSCALTSSRASTITRCSLRISMGLPVVQMMLKNIVPHRGGDMARGLVLLFAVGKGQPSAHLLAQMRANVGGRNVERKRRIDQQVPAGRGLQNVGAGTARVDFLCDRQRNRREVEAGPGGRANVREVEQAPPVAPCVEVHQLIRADQQRDGCVLAFARTPALQRVDGVSGAVVIDFVGRDAHRHAGQ